MDRNKHKKWPGYPERIARWIFAGSALTVVLLAGACRPSQPEVTAVEEDPAPEVDDPSLPAKTPQADPADPFAPAPPDSDTGTGAAPPSGPGDSPLLKKLKAIVIPKVEFAHTPLEDAIDFLVVRSRELDPDPGGGGVNVILEDGLASTQITLELTDIPLAEALRYTVELAGGQITIDEHAVVIGPKKGDSSGNASALADPAAEAALRKKLEELIVPSIEFQDTPLTDALAFLRDRSMELDADSPPDERGIDLMLVVPPESGIAIEDLRVTLTLQKIPLGEALKYTAKLAGLEFGVDGNIVVISSPGAR